MFVGDRMSKPVITVNPDMPIQEALNLMQRERIRRAPVVEPDGKLVGMVTRSDLLHASPSDATSLSVWEINFLLSRIQVGEIMSTEVVTVSEDTPVEEAALLMADNKIGGLPVLRDGQIVGIITETDLFKIFLEMFGARVHGFRVSAIVPNKPGELAKLTNAIFERKGNILGLGTFMGESAADGLITIKVSGISKEELEKAVQPVVTKIVDIRETQAT